MPTSFFQTQLQTHRLILALLHVCFFDIRYNLQALERGPFFAWKTTICHLLAAGCLFEMWPVGRVLSQTSSTSEGKKCFWPSETVQWPQRGANNQRMQNSSVPRSWYPTSDLIQQVINKSWQPANRSKSQSTCKERTWWTDDDERLMGASLEVTMSINSLPFT